MAHAMEMIGKIFGRLTITERGANAGKERRWWCLCECGNIKLIYGLSLRSGATRSCGCLAREVASKINTTHGMTGTTEWRAWASMKSRCSNEKIKAFHDYGGRGIKVCKEWQSSFLAFYRDMGSRPSPEHQIDRIDNNGNYCPENCRWVTRSENMRNRRVTKRYAGLTLKEWAEKTGKNYNTLKTRARRGNTIP